MTEVLHQPPAGLVVGFMTELNNYYAMPPVGITKTRGRIGEVIVQGYTVRCGDKACWFVGHSPSEADAQKLLDSHKCPAPPARNELPSGFSTIEKMWDQLDMATEAILESKALQMGDQNLDGVQLRGYARGISFSLSMMCHPHFRTETDIAREAAMRYKIRKGTMPYRPTPGYRFNPVAAPTSPPPGTSEPYHGATKPAAALTTATRKPRGTLSKAAQAANARVDLSTIDDKKRNQILNGSTMMGFTHEELAEMYDVTVETIKVIVDGRAS
jgi:hypothetical protein